jgi:hypothetical protein
VESFVLRPKASRSAVECDGEGISSSVYALFLRNVRKVRRSTHRTAHSAALHAADRPTLALMHQDDEGAAVHYERALAMSPNNAGIVRSYATFQAEPMERTPQLACPRMCSACARACVRVCVCVCACACVWRWGGACVPCMCARLCSQAHVRLGDRELRERGEALFAAFDRLRFEGISR